MSLPIKVVNAFSLNMVSAGTNIQTWPLTKRQVVALLEKNGVDSCIGHADTAAVVSTLLEIPIQFNRVSVELERRELAIVAQYKGPRLPEGSTTLPEGASVEFIAIYTGDQPDHHFCTGNNIYDIIERRSK